MDGGGDTHKNKPTINPIIKDREYYKNLVLIHFQSKDKEKGAAVGMADASTTLQQLDVNLPQGLPQSPEAQTPSSVLMSDNNSSTDRTANVSQMTLAPADTANEVNFRPLPLWDRPLPLWDIAEANNNATKELTIANVGSPLFSPLASDIPPAPAPATILTPQNQKASGNTPSVEYLAGIEGPLKIQQLPVHNITTAPYKIVWDIGKYFRLPLSTAEVMGLGQSFDQAIDPLCCYLGTQNQIRSGKIFWRDLLQPQYKDKSSSSTKSFEFFIKINSAGGIRIFARIIADEPYKISSAAVSFPNSTSSQFRRRLRSTLDEDWNKIPVEWRRLGNASAPEQEYVEWLNCKVSKSSSKFTCLTFEISFEVGRNPKEFQFESSLMSSKFSDVTISCGPRKFPAHKIVICAGSKVWDAKLSQTQEGNLNVNLTIENTEPGIVEEFLRFLYTGIVTDLAKNASRLLIVADKYGAQNLKAVSEKEILSTMDDENVLEYYGVGKLVNSEAIIRQCVERIKKNKSAIWKSEEEFDESVKKHPELIRKVMGLEFPTKARKAPYHEESGGNEGNGGKKQRTE